MNANKSLSNISSDRDMWIAQYRQEMRERDQRSRLSAALNKQAVALARKFMSMGHTAEEAAKFAEIDVSLLS